MRDQQHNNIGYVSIPDDIADDDTAVPVITNIFPPPTTTMTTMGHRSKWMLTTVRSLGIVSVVVLMQDGSSYDHSSGSHNTLIVAGITTRSSTTTGAPLRLRMMVSW